MANAQGLISKFQNFTRSADLLTILEWEELDTPQGQPYFLSYLFALRVPSDPLCSEGHAFEDDRITEFIPQTDKAIIGTRAYRGGIALVIKFE